MGNDDLVHTVSCILESQLTVALCKCVPVAQYGSTEADVIPYPTASAEFVVNPPTVVLQTTVLSQDRKIDDDDKDTAERVPLLQTSQPEKETWWMFLAQLFPSFMLAGLGMVGAGLLLDEVKTWPAFVEVSELFILVPGLLGLKGNLEMTLAARLSTLANLGKTESVQELITITVGNIALLQCQSVVVGALAALYAVLTTMLSGTPVTVAHVALVVSSSTVTASLASFALGGIMISVVVIWKKCGVNPDNVSIPIAASLGDITCLGFLALISNSLLPLQGSNVWIPVVIFVVLLVLLPAWVVLAYKNKYTKDVLFSGWMPIIGAMVISSVGGNILDAAIKQFSDMAAFQPLMNGVGGNLAAIQASRMSTYLHSKTDDQLYTDVKQLDDADDCASETCAIFTRRDANVRSRRLLLLLVVPGHLVFLTLISIMRVGSLKISFGFLVLYIATALLQVALLLCLTHSLIGFVWGQKMDPDTVAIPFVTAAGDLLGTALLALDFWLMSLMGMTAEVP